MTAAGGQSNKLRAIALYKELHRLGRDYPDPNYDFHGKLRRMFKNNRELTDPKEIEKAFGLAEYIRKETLALYSMRKYRHLKRAYHPLSPPAEQPSFSSGSPPTASSSLSQTHSPFEKS